MNCSFGLHYDAPSDQCLYPHQVECAVDLCEEKPNGNYKDPHNCDKYISCVWGIAIQMPCYDGLVYNAEIDECVYAHQTDCN